MDDLFAKPAAVSGKLEALSVTQLLRRMKNLLETRIGEVWVEGEVSNLRKQASGHWYFTLKDDAAQISCAMFGARRREGYDALADGAKVRIFAEASVYEARGQLQVIVLRAEPAGRGDLQARFESLKRKLHAEGLFAAERKKPLPGFPMAIGLVTSETGAALQDVLHVLSRRAPWVRAYLFPVRVQGRGAEAEIARAIRLMGRPGESGLPACDVLIVGRGGGSLEDLWNFNEEVVARAIAESEIPVISAVGHEIDFTIADFAADVRAPTPSAAAEIAVPDGVELRARAELLYRRQTRALGERLLVSQRRMAELRRGALGRDAEKALREPVMRVDRLRERISAHHPEKVIGRRLEALERMRVLVHRSLVARLENLSARLEKTRGMIRALGPESAFQRGFSITLGPDGKAVRSVAELHAGDEIVTKFAHGEARSEVRVVKP